MRSANCHDALRRDAFELEMLEGRLLLSGEGLIAGTPPPATGPEAQVVVPQTTPLQSEDWQGESFHQDFGVFALQADDAEATPNNWVGETTTGEFNNEANWSLGHAPVEGEKIMASGELTFTDFYVSVSNLESEVALRFNGILHLDDTLRAPTVTIASSGDLWSSSDASTIDGNLTIEGMAGGDGLLATYHVTGDLTLSEGGTLVAELGTHGNLGAMDRYLVDGQADLQGTVSFSQEGFYVGDIGLSYNILTSANATGAPTIQLTEASEGVTFRSTLDGQKLTATLVSDAVDAQVYQWRGTVDNDLDTAANWADGRAPDWAALGENDLVIINPENGALLTWSSNAPPSSLGLGHLVLGGQLNLSDTTINGMWVHLNGGTLDMGATDASFAGLIGVGTVRGATMTVGDLMAIGGDLTIAGDLNLVGDITPTFQSATDAVSSTVRVTANAETGKTGAVTIGAEATFAGRFDRMFFGEAGEYADVLMAEGNLSIAVPENFSGYGLVEGFRLQAFTLRNESTIGAVIVRSGEAHIFINRAGGDWLDADNWLGGAPDATTGDVEFIMPAFPNASAAILNAPDTTISVRTLYLRGNLQITAGTLELGYSLEIGGTLTLTGSDVILDGLNDSYIQVGEGGQLVLNDGAALNQTNGTIEILGLAQMNDDTSMTLAGDGGWPDLRIYDGGELIVGSGAIVSITGVVELSISEGGLLTLAGGTVGSESAVSIYGELSGYGALAAPVIEVYGMLAPSGGSALVLAGDVTMFEFEDASSALAFAYDEDEGWTTLTVNGTLTRAGIFDVSVPDGVTVLDAKVLVAAQDLSGAFTTAILPSGGGWLLNTDVSAHTITVDPVGAYSAHVADGLAAVSDQLGAWLSLFNFSTVNFSAQGLSILRLPFLTGELATLFDLSSELAPDLGNYSAVVGLDALVNALMADGYTVTGVVGGHDGVPAAVGGNLLTVTRTFALLEDASVNSTDSPANDGALNLLRGLASDLNLSGVIDWLADLSLTLSFSLDADGVFYLSGATGLALAVTGVGGTYSGTAKLGNRENQSMSGTYDANYVVQLGFVDSNAHYADLMAAVDSLAPSATGVAHFTLTANTGYVSFNYTADYTATAGVDARSTVIIDSHALIGNFAMPGLTDVHDAPATIVLSGTYDATNTQWILTGTGSDLRLAGVSLNNLTLTYAVSPTTLSGELGGALSLIPLRTTDNAAFTQNITATIDAESLTGTITTTAPTIELHENADTLAVKLMDVSVTTTLSADASSSSVVTQFAATSATLWPTTSGASFTAIDGEDLDTWAVTGTADSANDQVTVTFDTLLIAAAQRLEITALAVSLTIRRQQEQDYSATLEATARLLPFTLPLTEGQPAAPPSLTISLTLTSSGFTIANTTEGVAGLMAGEASLGATTLGLNGVGYARSTGLWSGSVTAQAESATLWSGRGVFVSDTAVKLSVSADLATLDQTFTADGLTYRLGDQLDLALPVLSFVYNPRDGPSAGFGIANNVIVTSSLLPAGVSATVNGVVFDWNEITLPAFEVTQSGLFAFNRSSGRIEFNNPVLSSEGFTYNFQTETGSGELHLSATNPLLRYPESDEILSGTQYVRSIVLTNEDAGGTEQFTLSTGGQVVPLTRAIDAFDWQATTSVEVGNSSTLGLVGSVDWLWAGSSISASFTGTLTIQGQDQTLTDAALTADSDTLSLIVNAAVTWHDVSFSGGFTVTLNGSALSLASTDASGSLNLFAQSRNFANAGITYNSDGTGSAAFAVALSNADDYTWTPSLNITTTSEATTYTFAASNFELEDGATLLVLSEFSVTRSDELNGDVLVTLNNLVLNDPVFGTTSTLNGVTLTRSEFTLPNAQQTIGDYAVSGSPFTLVAPTYAHTGVSVQLFPPLEPAAGNVWRGTFTLTANTTTSSTSGLSATQAVWTVSAEVMPPATVALTLGELVYSDATDGTVTLSDVTLTPGEATLYETTTAQAVLPGDVTVDLSRFAILATGEVIIDMAAPTGTFDATTVWIANFLRFDVDADSVQARYAGDTNLNGVRDEGETWDTSQVIFLVGGTLNFDSLSGFAFNPVIGINGSTYTADAADLVLSVAMIDGVATPWATDTITFGFVNWQIGDSASLSYTGALGAYANGAFITTDGSASNATVTFSHVFNSGASITGKNASITIDADSRTLTLVADFDAEMLKTDAYETPALTMHFALSATYAETEARTFTVGTATLGATLDGDFTYKPAGLITFTFHNVYFDFTATGGERMVFVETGTVRLDVATLNIVGTVTSFGLDATGKVSVGNDFSVELLGDEATLDHMKWPTFMPIRIDAFGLYWTDFNNAPGVFKLIMSATVDTSAIPLPIKFSGAIKGLVIDTSLLEQGLFPIVGMDAVELMVSGTIGGAAISGGFLLGLVRIDAQGNTLDVLDQTTPVARSVLYGAVRGSIQVSNFALEIYLGLSEYGPLAGYIRAGAPIPVDGGTMGFAISDLRGGIFFNSITPDITDARQLIAGTMPEITPVSMQSFDLWRAGFYNQLTTQILAANDPNPFWAMLTSPFRIEGGAQFYNMYATDNVFSLQVDIIFDSRGKITLVGNLDLFKNPADSNKPVAKFRLRVHIDLSKVADGDATILAHLEYLNQVGLSVKGKELKPLNIGIWGSLRLDFGSTIDPENPPESLFETISVEIVGGMGITGFDTTFAELDGTIRLTASLNETQAKLEFFGIPRFIGLSDVLGPMPTFQGVFEFSFNANDEVQLIGAFFGGGDLDLIQKAGISIAGAAVLRLNTSDEDVNFTLDLAGGAPRQILLPASTADLFIEGHLIVEYSGTRYFEMLGTLGIKVDTSGIALYGLGTLTSQLPGDVTLFHVDASLLAQISMNGAIPELVLVARFNAPQSPVLDAAGVTLNGLFEFLINTSGREVTFDIPTEFPDIIAATSITVTAGVPQLDGSEGSTAPWLLLRSDFALDPTRTMTFGNAFVASGDIFLAVSTADGATLSFNGQLDLVVESQTLLGFNANGVFVLDASGLYGFATATLIGSGNLPGGSAVTLSGNFRFEVNTTGVAHTLGSVTLGEGTYVRLHVDGALAFGRLEVNGTLDMSADANEGIYLAVEGTTALGIPGTDFLRFYVNGELGVTKSGVFGQLTLDQQQDYHLDGFNVAFTGTFYLAFNTTAEAWNDLPANGGVSFRQSGSITIGDLSITGNHSFTLSPDKLVLNLSGGIAFGLESEVLFTIPISLTVDITLPAIVIDQELSLSARDAGLDAFGFGADFALRLQVNSSGTAQGDLPAGPFVRLQVDGTLSVAGIYLVGHHTISADVRSVWVESDASLELRVANERLLTFTATGRGFFGFAGLAGRYAVGLSPGSLGELDLGDLVSLDYVFEFNTNGTEFTLPNDEVIAAGPFARLEANGALNLQGVEVNGQVRFFAESGQVRWSVNGSAELKVPSGPTLLSAEINGAGWIRSEGLVGAFAASAATLPVNTLGFTFDASTSFRLEINFTGAEQELEGGLTLEAGNYVRVRSIGSLNIGVLGSDGLSLQGEHTLKFEDNTLTLTTDGEVRFMLPSLTEGGESTVLLRVGFHGGALIDSAGIAGKFTAGLLDAASGVQQKFADLGITLDPSSFVYQLEFNTTGEARTVGSVTVAAGKYARLAINGVIDLGGFEFVGDFHLSVGSAGLDLGVDAIFDLKVPAAGTLPEVLLFRYRASGGLLITARGVAGILSGQVQAGQGDIAGLGFTLPSASYDCIWEANYTNEEVTVAGHTLEAGRYFRAVVDGEISFGTADYAGISGRLEFYVGNNQLELTVDGLAYLGVPQLDGPTLKVVQADVKGQFVLSAAGLYGEASVYRAVTPDQLNGLTLGMGADELSESAHDGLRFWVNTTNADQNIALTGNVLVADEVVGLSYGGSVDLDLLGGVSGLHLAGSFALILQYEGVQLRVDASATLFGLNANFSGGLMLAYDGVAAVFELNLPQVDLGDLHVITLGGHFEFQINTRGADQVFRFGEGDEARTVTVKSGAFLILVRDANVDILGSFVITGNLYFERTPDGVWRGEIPADAPLHVELIPGVTADVQGWLAEDGTHEFTGTVQADIHYEPIVSIVGRLDFVFRQLTTMDPALIDIDMDAEVSFLGTTATVTGTIDRDGENWDAHFHTQGDSDTYALFAGLTFEGQFDLHFEGSAFGSAVLTGELHFGGLDANGVYSVNVADGTTTISLDGQIDFIIPATDISSALDLGQFRIGGYILGDDSGWRGIASVTFIDEAQFNASLRTLGINVADPQFDFRFVINTTGVEQTINIPGGQTQTLAAGVYYRLTFDAQAEFLGTYVDAHWYFERDGGSTYGGVSGTWELAIPAVGDLPRVTFVSFHVDGRFAVVPTGIAGRFEVHNELMNFMPSLFSAALPSETQTSYFAFNNTGVEVQLGDEVLAAPSFVELRYRGKVALAGSNLVWFDGALDFRVGIDGLHAMLDVTITFGLPKENIVSSYYAFGAYGELFASRDGVYGELTARDGIGVGAVASAISFDVSWNRTIFLNTTGADQTLSNGRLLLGDEIAGFEIDGTLGLNFFGVTGIMRATVISDGMRFRIAGTANILGQLFPYDNYMEVTGEGVVGGAILTLPNFDLGGAGLITLGGNFVFSFNTTQSARYVEALGKTIAKDTVYLEARDLNIRGLYSLTGSFGFGFTGGQWVANISESSPLMFSLMPGWETTIYGYIRQDGTYNLTGTSQIAFGANSLIGLAANATVTLSSDVAFNGSFSGSAWLLGSSSSIAGTFHSVDDGYEFAVTNLTATVGGFGLTGGGGTLLVRTDKSARVTLSTPLTVSLPVLGTASFGGYVDSRGSFDLTATQHIGFAVGTSAPFRFAVEGSSALRIALEGSNWIFSMSNTLSVEAFGHSETKSYTQTFNGVGLDFYLPGNFTIGGLAVSGAATLSIRASGTSFIIADNAPLTTTIAGLGQFTLRGQATSPSNYYFSGTGSVSVGANNLAGLNANASLTVASDGTLNGSFSGSTWLLGANTSVSGAFRKVGGDFEFTVSNLKATVAGFGLTGGGGTLLVRSDSSVRITLSTPLTVSLPVLGTASFGGYVDSRGSFDLTATQYVGVAIGVSAPFRFAANGTSVLHVALEGSNWMISMSNVISVEAFGHSETKSYTQTFNGVGLDFYLPGSFTLGGLSVSGAATLRIRADGTSFIIDDNAPLTATIPLLGNFSLRGQATSPSSYSFTASANVNAGDPAGFVRLNGQVTLTVANTGISFAVNNGSVSFLGASALLTVSGVYRTADNYLSFNVPNITVGVSGLGSLTGGFTYVLQNGASTMTVDAGNPLRFTLFGATASFSGVFRSNGTSDLTGSASLDSGIGTLLRARGTLNIGYRNGTATASLAGNVVLNNVTIVSMTANVATDFSSYFEMALPRITFSLGGFSVTGSMSYRAEANGTRHLLKIGVGSPVSVSIGGFGAISFTGSMTAQGSSITYDLNGRLNVSFGNTTLGAGIDASLKLSNSGISASGSVYTYVFGSKSSQSMTLAIYTDRVEFGISSSFSISGVFSASVSLDFVGRSTSNWQLTIKSGSASLAGFGSISIGGTLGSGGINISGSGSATAGSRGIASFEGTIYWSYGSSLSVSLSGTAYVINTKIGSYNGGISVDSGGFSMSFNASISPASGLSASGRFNVRVEGGGAYVSFSGTASLFGTMSGGVNGSFDSRWGRTSWNVSGEVGFYIGNGNVGASGGVSFSVGPGYANASAHGSVWIGFSLSVWVSTPHWFWPWDGYWTSVWIGGSASFNAGVDWNARTLYFGIAGRSVRVQFGGGFGVYFSEVSGSTVFFDANRNGLQDPDEPWAITDANGNVDFSAPFDPVPEGLGALERYDANHNGVLDEGEGQFVVNGGTRIGDSNEAASDYTFFSGSANGGTLFSGATIFFDANGNGVRDEDEPITATDAQGFYVFANRPAVGLGALASFDTNGNGVIDPEEGVLYVEGGFERAASGQPTMIRYFVDANGDGQYDEGESSTIASADAGYDLMQLIRSAMQTLTVFDTDSDGVVSDAELMATSRDGDVLYLDTNGNGVRDASELQADLPAVGGDLGVFAALDANGNGTLDASEFEAIASVVMEGTPVIDPIEIPFAASGYVSVNNATRVFLDANGNGRYDDGEAMAIPDANGFYTFITPTPAEVAARLGRLAPYDLNGNGRIDPEEGIFVVVGGTDNNNGLENPIVALGLADQYGTGAGTALGTISTLIVSLTDLGLSPEEARARVDLTFGLNGGGDTIDPTDLYSTDTAQNAQLLQLSAQLNTLILGGAAALGDANSPASQRAVIDALARWILANVRTTQTNNPNAPSSETQPTPSANLSSGDFIGEILGDTGSTSPDAVGAAKEVIAATNTVIEETVTNSDDVTSDLARIKAVTIGMTTTQLTGVAEGQADAGSVVSQLTGEGLANAINSVQLLSSSAPVLADGEVVVARLGATVIVPLTVTDLDTPQRNLNFSADLTSVANRVQSVSFNYEQGRWLATVTLRADAPTGAFVLPVLVNDGNATANAAIHFASVLADPTISSIGPLLVNAGEATAPITIQLGNVSTDAVLTVASDNALILPASSLLLSGIGDTRLLTITSPAGVRGVAWVTLTLNDNGAIATQRIKVAVTDGTPLPELVANTPSASLSLDTNAEPISLDLASLFNRSDDVTYVVEVETGSDLVSVAQTGTNALLNILPERAGLAEVRVSATDGFDTAIYTLTLQVQPEIRGTVLEANEALGSAKFAITVTPSNTAFDVAYRTVDGTALAGRDYEATSGVLHFAPGKTRQVLEVTILDNSRAGDQTLHLQLGDTEDAAHLITANITDANLAILQTLYSLHRSTQRTLTNTFPVEPDADTLGLDNYEEDALAPTSSPAVNTPSSAPDKASEIPLLSNASSPASSPLTAATSLTALSTVHTIPAL